MLKDSKSNGTIKSPADGQISMGDNSIAMLNDSLEMTPWERILANDDVVNFGDSLRGAMEKRNAESRRLNPKAD